jgi:cell division protein FtsZ
MGIGRASGENRAIEAARQAIDSPLLELSIDGAMGILYNITGGPDMTMYEVEEASKAITEAAHPESNIIFGAIVDDAMSGEIKITVIATGFETEMAKPQSKRRPMSSDESIGFHSPLGEVPANPTPSSIPFFNRQPLRERERERTPAYQPAEEPDYELPVAPPRRERHPAESPKPYTPPKLPRDDVRTTTDDEDNDLDVPAFIRRKLR